MRRCLLALGALSIGVSTLMAQLFLTSGHIIYAAIALMPLGFAWIVHNKKLIEPVREIYLFTFIAQLFFMATLYFRPMFYGRLVQDIYIALIGTFSGGIIASVAAEDVLTPILYTMVVFGILELALDENLRNAVSK